MPLEIHLMGRPHLVDTSDPGAVVYRFRSQKSWALLAYLLLSEPVSASRAMLADLLFDAADDPLRALRWSLAEIRRGLGDGAAVEGDPVSLRLPPGAVVDAWTVTQRGWTEALAMPGLGRELLESCSPQGSPAFDVWLLTERRRLAASSEAALHEAALGRRSAGDLPGAIDAAGRAVAMNPLDENSQALLIRLFRESGDMTGARQAFDSARRVLREDLGVEPGFAVEAAWREAGPRPATPPSRASVQAVLESGSAAIAAGAVPAGLETLSTAVSLADAAADADLRIRARLVFAETLVHSVRGMDEHGISILHEADAIALASGDSAARVEIRTELGYVDFLRGRYQRAEHWLSDALAHADPDSEGCRKARAYLGSVHSDRADYPRALASLGEGAALPDPGGARRAAYALSMIGRIHLVRGDLEEAARVLAESMALAEQDRWLSFLPWPQSLLGETLLAGSEQGRAGEMLEQAFARACQLGDPCWEGAAARALALHAAHTGDASGAFERLAEAQTRSRRVSDSYLWLDAAILDAACTIGRRFGHPDLSGWVADLQALAQRTDMREMTVRALVHAAALGDIDAVAPARLMAVAIDNVALDALVAELPG